MLYHISVSSSSCKMGSYILGEPLGSPMQYDPSFKVDACLHEPLWCVMTSSTREVALDMITLCAQLDLLCQRELTHLESKRIDGGNVSNIFETKAVLLLEKMKMSVQQLPQPNLSVREYLDQTGLSKLYPRTATYVAEPKSFSLLSEKTVMDGYFTEMANLHQVASMATQINNDVTTLANHKYVAHQLALLHQSLAVFNAYKPLVQLRKNIESNFAILKEALSQQGGRQGKPVNLPQEQVQWVLDVTRAIVNEVTSLPSELTSNSLQPALLLTHI